MSIFLENDEGFTVVYADGSCFSNGTYGAKAGIGVWFGDSNSYNVSAPVIGRATNNNAEIQAITAAANQALKANIQYLKIYTDSEFVINCATKWMSNWKRYNWRKANGEPVINREELIDMDYALSQLENVYFEHVRGHQGNYGNQQADQLARAGADLYQSSNQF